MSKKIKIIQVGLGGYGQFYLNHLLDENTCNREDSWDYVAGVDPSPERCNRYQELQKKNIPVYADLTQALEKHQADLVILVTPIHTHLSLCTIALESGASVLLEKPLCGSVAEADEMQQAEDAAKGFVAVGFQWHYAQSTQALLSDMRAGDFGELLSVKTKVLWPRDYAYYQRSAWAGARYTANGAPIFDGPAMNACAHFLYQQLLIIGGGQAAEAQLVDARLMRANNIENYDTAVLQYTSGNTDALFICSHSIEQQKGPHAIFQYKHAQVTLNDDNGLTAYFTNGETRSYGVPNGGREKINTCIDRLHGKESIICRIADAKQHIVLIEQLKDLTIIDAPKQHIKTSDSALWVDGLFKKLEDAYDKMELPQL